MIAANKWFYNVSLLSERLLTPRNKNFEALNWFQFFRFFRYLATARHYKGFGIHSPFVFHLVSELIYGRYSYYAFTKIEAIRSALLRERHKIDAGTFGAPSKTGKSKQQQVKQVVKGGSLPPKYGRLLFRLINHFGLKNILELGTGVGMSTIYFAMPSLQSRVWSIEGNRDKAKVAKELFGYHKINHINVIEGRFNEVLPGVLCGMPSVDFVFFDGDHRREPTIEYFNACVKRAHNNTLFVFDDIHWSREMESAWGEIIRHPSVTVSIDLFRLGLVFFRKECLKQHYKVWF